MVTKVSVTE